FARDRRVRRARSVTGLASDAHLGPRGRVAVRRRIEVLHQVGGVAVDAGDVPDLTQVVIGIVWNRRDLLPVDPSLRFVVPEDRKDVDAAVGELREIALKAAGAERVMNLEGLGRPSGRFRNRDEVTAVAPLERVAAAVLGEPDRRRIAPRCRRGAELALDQRLGDRLRHLHVQRPPPGVVRRLMTALARLRSEVGRCRRRRGRPGERHRDDQRHHGETDQNAGHEVTIMPAVTLRPLSSGELAIWNSESGIWNSYAHPTIRLLLAGMISVHVTAASLAATAQVTGSARTALATVEEVRTRRPVVDVGPDDFVVQEGAEAREVLSVRAADYPVVLMIDSGAAADDLSAIRKASKRFLERLGSERPVAVGIFDGGARMLAGFDADRSAL